MTREQAFNSLYEKLSVLDGSVTFQDDKTKKVSIDTKDCLIILEHKGKYYEYELFIANKDGFTTVDIAILYEETEDYKWCWKWLNVYGVSEL